MKKKTLIQFYVDDDQMNRIEYIMARYKRDSAIDSRAVAINKVIATIYNQLKDEDNENTA